jgi:hypothetical protein
VVRPLVGIGVRWEWEEFETQRRKGREGSQRGGFHGGEEVASFQCSVFREEEEKEEEVGRDPPWSAHLSPSARDEDGKNLKRQDAKGAKVGRVVVFMGEAGN